ncbi:SDR family NAD(P)-dependent oxidoreductase [Alteraurantiacibacter aestuarii]|uniref:SDR family oxidoreductase n=1 Tax=Alteraurantiacibacter aestuarii TaxID=650004 RepID=A0A844ZMF2_9SPHN|nr:SDR family NAD(P)-dependent oxidoreductase [Alteraurantiacibacter aestuarii]MXO88492.1 SDR family oxidoreductase [Alteraurantiacibacter aestuarii]
MTKRHVGNSVIVTGAAGAIGYATCEILAREGAEVLMVDIAADRLEKCGHVLRAKGYHVITHVADCADEAAVEGYAKAAMEAFGKIDGFFNNAGIEGDLAPTHEYDIAMFDKVLHVNLRGMFLGLRFVLPHMVAAGKGAVVNTASIGSERGLAGACAYNATKHGAVGLTRTAASEVAQKGVRVNCVMPGVIETPLLVGMLEQMFDSVEAGMKKLGEVATLNRVGQPPEVGNVVSFLLSDEASYVNGAKWEIDGGALATIRNDI